MATLKDAAAAIEKRGAQRLVRSSVVLPLPIFEGQYAARFGVLPPARLDAFEASGRGEDLTDEESHRVAADLLADSCRYLLARLEPGGEFVKLTHDSDGRPVRFDAEFAETIGLEPLGDATTFEDMADVVLACWTTDDGEVSGIALQQFTIRLLGWFRDTARTVEGELAGEALGGTS